MIMRTLHRLLVSSACLLLVTGCASYRNKSLDHRLQVFESPALRLDGLKSVQSREGQNPGIALALAVSGGGHRAANFATGILLGMESAPLPGTGRSMLQEIDYFSTVSGGGFASGAYLAALHDHIKNNSAADFSLRDALLANKERMLYDLRRDYQTSVLVQWLHPSCFGYRDAGDLMERRFDGYLLGSRYRTDGSSLLLGDIFKPTGSPDPVRLPYWIANATLYENGARFMFTPAFIKHYRIDRYTHNMRFHNLNGNPLSLPTAVGMKASASFPVLFPATTFTCNPEEDKLNPYLHLVDGGLTDNNGVKTALELLRNDPAPRKILLVIDAYAKSAHPYSSYRTSPDGAGVAFRIMNMGLDAEHARLREGVSRQAAENNVEVRFLGFDQLKPVLQESISDLKAEIGAMRKQRTEGLTRRLRRELDWTLRKKQLELETVESESANLYEDARNVATSLNITRGEQSVLLKTGQAVINRNKSDLTDLLKQ
jgi:hypothetical protein